MKRLFLILTIVLVSFLASAVTVKDLQKQKKQNLEKLAVTNRMLNETQKGEANSISRLAILNEQIKMRQALVSNLNGEIKAIDARIAEIKNEIAAKDKRIEELKANYAKLIYHINYKQTKQDKLMFLLSANSFSETYRRYRYLKEYGAFHRQQTEELEATKKELEALKTELEDAKRNRTISLQERQSETNKLADEKNKQNILLSDLKKKESTLLKQLKEQQRKADEFNRKIEKLIAEEAAKAEAKRKAELAKKQTQSGGKTTTPTVATLTKEEALIAGNFEKNIGRLPWPVERGVITGKFGVQPHPIIKNVTTNNKGIYVQTTKGAVVRAVFDGEVTQRFSIPGSNNAIIIKHGNYRTVYTNLTDIYVKIGDKVTTKQSIGKLYTDEEENKTELYFQIWKDKVVLNPEIWLAK